MKQARISARTSIRTSIRTRTQDVAPAGEPNVIFFQGHEYARAEETQYNGRPARYYKAPRQDGAGSYVITRERESGIIHDSAGDA